MMGWLQKVKKLVGSPIHFTSVGPCTENTPESCASLKTFTLHHATSTNDNWQTIEGDYSVKTLQLSKFENCSFSVLKGL